jgi:hypothetical protein
MTGRTTSAVLALLLLAGCSGGEEPPREPEQLLSEDNPFKPLVDSHDKAGGVEAQVLEQAAGTRRAVEEQTR